MNKKILLVLISILILFLSNCNSTTELRKQEFSSPVKPEEIKSGCYRQVGVKEAKFKPVSDTKSERSNSISETIPAKKEIKEEKVLVKEAYTSCNYNKDIVFCKQMPAIYKTIKVEVEYSAHTRTVQTSDVTITTTRLVPDQPESPDIRKVVCPEEVTSFRIKKIQENLKNSGNDPGPMDGILYKSTMKAIKDYEMKRGFKEEEQSGEDFIVQKTFDLLSK